LPTFSPPGHIYGWEKLPYQIGQVRGSSREKIWGYLVVLWLLININSPQNLGHQQGFDITVSGWQSG
jgi:hypothetical protein